MGDFSEAALEIAVEMSGDLSEQVVSFDYIDVLTDDSYSWRGIPTQIMKEETDGESVTMTSSKYWCLRHELPREPMIDDALLIGTKKHIIARVSPADNVIGWYIYTNAHG